MPVVIMSKVQPDQIAHLIFRRQEIVEKRTDIADAKEGLQVAAFRLPKDGTFKPHYHLPRPREIPRTQETWIVISGKIGVTYYDFGGEKLAEDVLNVGDCSISFFGGHNYVGLCNEGSEVYEVKTGPFVGVLEDKRHIS